MKLSTFVKSTLIPSVLMASSFTSAANIEVNTNSNDIAISGYDTVSYFTQGKPVQGSSKFTAAYKGAVYQFHSADNRNLFKAEPSKYAPQYGGFCAMGVALNKKLDADPTAWYVRDEKLYLNFNKAVQKKWTTDIPGYIETAQVNWIDIKGLTEEQIEKVYD